MIRGDLEQFAAAIGAVVSGDATTGIQGVGIDTREDLAGRLFIAIQGDRHDGHDHLAAARKAGAAAAMVAAGAIEERGGAAAVDLPLLIVEDTIQGPIEAYLEFLQQYLLRYLVYAHIFAIASSKDAGSIGRIADAGEVTRGCIVVRCHSIVHFPSSCNVSSPINLTNQ